MMLLTSIGTFFAEIISRLSQFGELINVFLILFLVLMSCKTASNEYNRAITDFRFTFVQYVLKKSKKIPHFRILKGNITLHI